MTKPTDCLTPKCAAKKGDFRPEKKQPQSFITPGGAEVRMVNYRCKKCGKPVYSVDRVRE